MKPARDYYCCQLHAVNTELEWYVDSTIKLKDRKTGNGLQYGMIQLQKLNLKVRNRQNK